MVHGLRPEAGLWITGSSPGKAGSCVRSRGPTRPQGDGLGLERFLSGTGRPRARATLSLGRSQRRSRCGPAVLPGACVLRPAPRRGHGGSWCGPGPASGALPTTSADAHRRGCVSKARLIPRFAVSSSHQRLQHQDAEGGSGRPRLLRDREEMPPARPSGAARRALWQRQEPPGQTAACAPEGP